MKFSLEIESSNTAFEDNYGFDELARILREVARLVENGNVRQSVRDVNGNAVGEYIMEVDEIEDDDADYDNDGNLRAGVDN